MRHLDTLLEVARWEFRRYVKLRQQLVGLAITLVFIFGGALIGANVGGPRTVEVPVVGHEHLPELPEEAGRLRLDRQPAAAEAELRREVEEGERHALLVIEGPEGGTLVARRAPGWRSELAAVLDAVVREQRLAASALDAETLAAIEAPYGLTVHETAPRSSGGGRAVAFLALGLTLIGLFSGVSYIFISVTGEKQNRLSEQVISAISPQAWIDGKILGLSGVSIVSVLNLVVASVVFLVAARAMWGWAVPLPTGVQSPGALGVALVLILLGYVFWFAFLTAVAALVDDPHTSTRNQLLFLPLLPMVAAFLAVSDPEAGWVQVLSVVPPVSSAVMPARLLVTEVPALEVLASVVLMVGAIWAMRWAAGKIFQTAMLMYGKEPSWGEVRRWLRER